MASLVKQLKRDWQRAKPDVPERDRLAHICEYARLSCLWQGAAVPLEEVADYLVAVVGLCEQRSDFHGEREASRLLGIANDYMRNTWSHDDVMSIVGETFAWNFRRPYLLHGPMPTPAVSPTDRAFEWAMAALLHAKIAKTKWSPERRTRYGCNVDTASLDVGIDVRGHIEYVFVGVGANGPRDLSHIDQRRHFFGGLGQLFASPHDFRCYSFVNSADPLDHLREMIILTSAETSNEHWVPFFRQWESRSMREVAQLQDLVDACAKLVEQGVPYVIREDTRHTGEDAGPGIHWEVFRHRGDWADEGADDL